MRHTITITKSSHYCQTKTTLLYMSTVKADSLASIVSTIMPNYKVLTGLLDLKQVINDFFLSEPEHLIDN